MSDEPLKEENFKLKKQLKLNRRLSKMIYDMFMETLEYKTSEDTAGKEALDNSMKKLDEEYNKLMGDHK